jgi:hypothetical protein
MEGWQMTLAVIEKLATGQDRDHGLAFDTGTPRLRLTY